MRCQASTAPEVLTCLVTFGADVNAVDNEWKTPLALACLAGLEANVKTLLVLEASPQVTDMDARTPLHEAAMAGNVELAKVLLAAGASVDAAIKEGWNDIKEGMTPRDIAVLKAHAKVTALLPG